MYALRYQRLVVKLGTSTLTAGSPNLSKPQIDAIVGQVASLCDIGCEIIIVSSGAMAAGRERLAFPELPREIPSKQMLSAVGQPRLMALYEQLFGLHGRPVAQVLLTRADLARRGSYLNARNTLRALLDHDVLPVVNENDTTATEEIRVGDNDNLSALVANLIDADLLLILTDQPGMFTADPRQNPEAKMLQEVTTSEIPPELWKAAGGTDGNLGSGGMMTKLQAADLARRSGTETIIAQGSNTNVIIKAARGQSVGTRFTSLASALESRKRYILSGWDGKASVTVDTGAMTALQDGSSLLPVGVSSVVGTFGRGDTVAVFSPDGREVARGLSSYPSSELLEIIGLQSDQISERLGYAYGDEVIHRDQLVLLK